MSIGPVVDYQNKYQYVYLDKEPNQIYSDLYVIIMLKLEEKFNLVM